MGEYSLSGSSYTYELSQSSSGGAAASSSAYVVDSAPAGEQGVITNTNPGSQKHPLQTCKPCNKYNPERPDSCRHGDKCEFCHEPHERPKHRGQRGRHAQQRRQYLDAREEMAQAGRAELVKITDKVYQRPHDIFEEVKRRLQHVSKEQRPVKVQEVLERVREIGEQAQDSRPDKHRVRGARIVTPEGVTPVSELDGRCKWLIGTLHLMVRKMTDADTSMKEIDERVNDVLSECAKLPSLVLDDSMPSGQVQLTPAFKWLERKVTELASQESRVVGEGDVESKLAHIRKLCGGFSSKIEQNDVLLHCTSLAQLHDNLKELLERHTWALTPPRAEPQADEPFDLSRLEQALKEDEEASYISQYQKVRQKVLESLKLLALKDEWDFLEEKIKVCAVEEIKSGGTSSSSTIEEHVKIAFESATKLPQAVEKIRETLAETPGIPASLCNPAEIRKNFTTRLDSCQGMTELLEALRDCTKTVTV